MSYNKKTTIFHSVHTFTHIRQHCFSKYWGDQCMGRPPTSIFFGGDRPPSPPYVSAPECLSFLFLLLTPTPSHPSITLCMLSRFWFMIWSVIMVDYGNAVYTVSSANASKLQSILNAAARLRGGTTKFSHVSFAVRNSLHYLPIRKLIQFKICYLIRNCLTGSNILQVLVVPLFELRLGPIGCPRTRTSMTQSRSFAIAGPSNWNKLSQSLRYLFPIPSE